MKKNLVFLLLLALVKISAQSSVEKLGYHDVKTDAGGNILPWYSSDFGESFDHTINIVWKFWDTMRVDLNGLPYYMNHQVWRKNFNDSRGIGGDQVAMALSSWRLLYAYSGDPKILDNMKFMADYYLSHSLSPANYKWANIPYPYNRLTYSGIYDGDMIMGKGYIQPDKAGSFAYELINLYKISGKEEYLIAAVDIANTLSSNTKHGNNEESPLPFRVDAKTGKVGEKNKLRYGYTTNWTGTMMLFSELISMRQGKVASYRGAFQSILEWMKKYPMKTNKWGPFFEDVDAWSDTEINSVTFAQYIMNNTVLFPNWKEDVKNIFAWVYKILGNKIWEKYGVIVSNEQTDYQVPGNSHTARLGAAELLFASMTNDAEAKKMGLRQLSWATYMVNNDGENTYPNNETWMTDGYVDYVRHYLRAMATFSELAPANQNHLVNSSSVIKYMKYSDDKIEYETYDESATEVLRLKSKPKDIMVDTKYAYEPGSGGNNNFWIWEPLVKGGLLKLDHKTGKKIVIRYN
jgi:hypothetical protein